MKTDLVNDDEVQKELNEAENEKKLLDYKLSKSKIDFIDEIKSGLGKQIKENGNKVEVIKPSIWKRFGNAIKRIFTNF